MKELTQLEKTKSRLRKGQFRRQQGRDDDDIILEEDGEDFSES